MRNYMEGLFTRLKGMQKKSVFFLLNFIVRYV